MIEKEVTALLPVWVVAAFAILASHWQIDALRYLGVSAYFIGTAVLGAWALGHEYTYRTLPFMLALPVPRWRWWAVKLAVLAPMLATLTGLAWVFLPLDRGDQSLGLALFALPPLVALFVAPWLTMATGSPTAAAVLAFSAMGGSLALGELIGVLRPEFTADAHAFRVAFIWWAAGGLSLVGAVMGWRSFRTLEAPDGAGEDIQLTIGSRRARPSVTRAPALVALVGKELRLQQLSLVVAVTFSAIYLLVALTTRRVDPALMLPNVLLTFYVVVIPIVLGSAAVAEERRFGMLDMQLLLPVGVVVQWAIKAAVTLGLAIALGLVLPVALVTVAQPPPSGGLAFGMMVPQWLVFGGCFTAVALYVSSLTRSGMRAMVLSIAVIPVLAYFCIVVAANQIGSRVFTAVYRPHVRPLAMFSDVWPFVITLAGFVLLALTLAGANFRRVDHSALRVAAQAGLAVTVILAYTVALSVWLALRF